MPVRWQVQPPLRITKDEASLIWTPGLRKAVLAECDSFTSEEAGAALYPWDHDGKLRWVLGYDAAARPCA